MVGLKTFGIVLGAGALALWPATPASAAESVSSGWWTAAPVAAAPDVPADGMLVQGGSDANNPMAYAAVSYSLASGEEPTAVTFTIAEGSATTPNASLTLCPLQGSFSPTQGGASADAPKFDCGTKVTAAPSTDGASYVFRDLGTLVQGGTLAVAILPGATTDRVVFSKPAADSLESTQSTESSGSVTGSEYTDTATGTDSFADFGTTDTRGFEIPSAPAADVPAPSPATAPKTPVVTSNQAALAAAAGGAASDDDFPLAPVAFVGLFILAAVLWLSAGHITEPLAETEA